MKTLCRWLVSIVVVASCCPTMAQEILWHAIGRYNVNWLAMPLVFVGDLDGDGFEELVNIGQKNQGSRSGLFIISGRTGQVLRSRQPPTAQYWYVGVTEAGDWNRDGVRDYAVGRHDLNTFGPPVVEVLSGRDDSVLLSHTGHSGDRLLSDIDTDGDRSPDLVVAVERETSQGGAIYVYSNAGLLRYRHPIHHGNTNVGKVGDLDRDGCDDFAYASISAVRVLSGRTGTPIFDVRDELPNDNLGLGAIVACGDVNGDGVPDFAVSSAGVYPTNAVVRVCSGRDGAALFTFRKAFPPNGSGLNFGESIASGFDLDQDGIQDLVVGGCGYDCDLVRQVGDRVFVYLLRDGREIEICTPDLPSVQWFTKFGVQVAVGKPQPGNPFPVFACGEAGYGIGAQPLTHLGRVTLFRLPSSVVRPEGHACEGTLPRAPRAGVVELGTAGVRMHLSDAPSNAPAVLLVGLSNRSWAGLTLPIKLHSWGFLGCELATSVEAVVPTVTGSQGIRAGHASVDLPLPVTHTMPRRMVYAQWLVFGSGAQTPGALSVALGWPF